MQRVKEKLSSGFFEQPFRLFDDWWNQARHEDIETYQACLSSAYIATDVISGFVEMQKPKDTIEVGSPAINKTACTASSKLKLSLRVGNA